GKRHVRRVPEWIGPRDAEDIVLPVLHRAGRRAELQRQLPAGEFDGRRAVEAVGVGPGIAVEGKCGTRIEDALALAGALPPGRAVGQSFIQRPHLGTPVVSPPPRPPRCRGAEVAIEHRVHEGVAQLRVIEVREDRDAQAPVRDEPDDGGAAFDRARVIGDELAAIFAEEPAEAVRLEVRVRHLGGGIRVRQHLLWAKQLREVRGADEPFSRNPAAVEKAAPAGATGSTIAALAGSTRTVSRTMPCGALTSVTPAACMVRASG